MSFLLILGLLATEKPDTDSLFDRVGDQYEKREVQFVSRAEQRLNDLEDGD